MAFHPYVNFGGNCREAFTYYHELFGGDLNLLSWADLPGDQQPPSERPDLIMHAALTAGETLLMGSDAEPDNFNGMNGAYVNYSTHDAGEAKRIYDALAEGGEPYMPLSETFFSPAFGMCRDRFGVNWMINTWSADNAQG
jgi:PhnB protein